MSGCCRGRSRPHLGRGAVTVGKAGAKHPFGRGIHETRYAGAVHCGDAMLLLFCLLVLFCQCQCMSCGGYDTIAMLGKLGKPRVRLRPQSQQRELESPYLGGLASVLNVIEYLSTYCLELGATQHECAALQVEGQVRVQVQVGLQLASLSACTAVPLALAVAARINIGDNPTRRSRVMLWRQRDRYCQICSAAQRPWR